MSGKDVVEPDTVAKTIEITGNAAAPFIYFDMASAHAVEGGVIIIELVARTVVAEGGGGARNEIVATGHLRCGLVGAKSLQAALNGVGLILAPAPEGKAN